MESITQNINAINKGIQPNFGNLALDKICADYPCFQAAFMLKSLSLFQKDKENFNEQLPLLAIHVPDRAKLYDVLHADYSIEQTTEQTQSETIPQSEEQNFANVTEDVEVENLINQAENLKEADVIIESTKEVAIQNASNETISIPDDIDAIKELAKTIKKKPKAKEKKETKEVASVKKPKAPTEKKEKPKKTKELKPKAPVKKNTAEKSVAEFSSFLEWLNYKKNLNQTQATVTIQKEEKKAKQEEESIIDPSVGNEAALMMEVKNSSFKLEDFLVDQIERKHTKKELSKSQINHFVSETYAEILVAQGKNEDAIRIYKELSIKYPNNSAKFARQIEKLKNS